MRSSTPQRPLARAAKRPTAYLDLDGCLVDSRIPIGLSIDRTLADLGVAALGPGELDACIGPPIVEGFCTLLLARSMPAAQAERAVDIYRKFYGPISLEHTSLVPGIASMLRRLTERADAVIVTSKAQPLAEPIVDALGIRGYFDAVVGPSLNALKESKIETLQRARAARRIDARDAMIGDRRHDVEAALAHRMHGIGVTWGIGSREELLDAGAESIIERPDQLIECFADVPGG